MQHVDGASLGLVYAVANIDRNTRHDPRLCSRPFPGNRPVNVPTEQSGNLYICNSLFRYLKLFMQIPEFTAKHG